MRRREEYGYVIDVLPPEVATYRLPARVRRDFPHDATYVHVVGEEYFTLLEATLKRGAVVEVGERVYVGSGTRDKIDKIVRRVKYDELQAQGRENLAVVIKKLVNEREGKFVKWFNEAGPITIKLHSLELLRGVGKKKLQEILEERRKKPFTSYDDVKQRIGVDLAELVVDRILRELSGSDPYYVFTIPPSQ